MSARHKEEEARRALLDHLKLNTVDGLTDDELAHSEFFLARAAFSEAEREYHRCRDAFEQATNRAKGAARRLDEAECSLQALLEKQRVQRGALPEATITETTFAPGRK